MPFSIRPDRRFPVQFTVTYNAGPFQGQGTVWNLSLNGWKLSGKVPLRVGQTQEGKAMDRPESLIQNDLLLKLSS